MVQRLGLAGAGIEGRGDDDGIRAGRLGDLRMANDAVGRGVDDAGQQRNAAVVHLHRMVEDRAPRGFVVEHDLAGGAEHEQAVHAAFQQVFDARA